MNNKLSKSEFHAEFIHDIIEMEYKANALRTLAGQCRKKANGVQKEWKESCEKARTWMLERENVRNRVKATFCIDKPIDKPVFPEYKTIYETKNIDTPRKKFSVSRIAVIWFLIFVSIMMVPFVAEFLIERIAYEKMGYFFILLAILTIILAVLLNFLFVFLCPMKHESYVEEKKIKIEKPKYNYGNIEKNAEEWLETAKKDYQMILDEKPQYDKTAEELYTKALYLEKQADILDKNKNKMYDMNIIPPDYRDLVYLFGFYKIFRNNLADTMREAVLLYEERDYREKALNALNRIGNKLGLISEYIMDMSDNLYRIGNDVNFMSGEIQNIRVIQEDNNDQQNEMMREIRATRYANEAVQRSNEQCEWYLHHQYWGI